MTTSTDYALFVVIVLLAVFGAWAIWWGLR